MEILHSKLLAPKIGNTISRERDSLLCDEISQKSLTIVTAGAGYGKTTFIARATAEIDSVWYRLADTDRDVMVFLQYLAAGIGRLYPQFGIEIREYIQDESTLGKDIQAVLTRFLHVMETTIESHLTIVLDDFHTVQDCREIRDCVQLLIEHIPKDVHFILMGRTSPDLAVSRLRLMGEVFEISENDLALNAREVSQLFSQVFGTELPAETVETIHSRSQGWIASLILFYHAMKGRDQDQIRELLMLLGSGRAVSEYLEENVFSLMPDETRVFLLKTCLLSRLNGPFCDRLLEIQTSGRILADLEKNHFFTFSLDEAGLEYVYHQIFQDYLRSRVGRTFPEAEIRALHERAAFISEEMGMPEEALHHYISAGAYTEASRILASVGLGMIREGRMNLVTGYLEEIPQNMVSQNPWLVFLRAHIDNVLGMSRKAILSFEKARSLFEKQGHLFGVDLCEYEMGSIYFPMGYFMKAEEIFTRIISRPSCNPLVHNMLLTQLVFITAQLGKLDLSDKYFQEGMVNTAMIEDQSQRQDLQAMLFNNHSVRWICSGDFSNAVASCRQAKDCLEGRRNDRLRYIYYNQDAIANFHAGRFAEGIESAKAGLTLARDKGFRDTTMGWLLMAYSMNSSGLKNITDAIDYGEKARRYFDETGSLWGGSTVCLALQSIYLKAGDINAAEDITCHGLSILESIDLPENKRQLIMGLALIRTLQGKTTEAESLMEGASIKDTLSQLTLLWEACIRAFHASTLGLEDRARDHARRCLDIGLANGYDFWITESVILMLVPLASLYERGEMKDYLRTVFARIDSDMKVTLSQMENMGIAQISHTCRTILDTLPPDPAPGLRVYTFGKFRIFRGDEEIPASRWKSKKAKMLFKLLVHYRPKGYVNKEVFMEHLWPEEDPRKTAKSFHVALVSLRKVLEPYLHRGIASSYILGDGDNYQLDLGSGGWIDLEEFEDACTKVQDAENPEIALQHLSRAAGIFRGDFLEEDLYEPWCANERTRLNDEYLLVLASIIDYHEMKKDYQKAIAFCGKYLAKDAYAEDMYQRLIRFHALSGNRAMAKKTYERCRKSIVEDLNLALSKETEFLARELISDPESDSR
jgi:LuxR family transcriptional regulator, maltose regulon positive regulatory protein